jgi:hypothetical protein
MNALAIPSVSMIAKVFIDVVVEVCIAIRHVIEIAFEQLGRERGDLFVVVQSKRFQDVIIPLRSELGSESNAKVLTSFANVEQGLYGSEKDVTVIRFKCAVKDLGDTMMENRKMFKLRFRRPRNRILNCIDDML